MNDGITALQQLAGDSKWRSIGLPVKKPKWSTPSLFESKDFGDLRLVDVLNKAAVRNQLWQLNFHSIGKVKMAERQMPKTANGIFGERLSKHEIHGMEKKALIKNADMTEEMQQVAIECAKKALETFTVEKDIAAHIKKEFDKKYTPTWHCIVGRNFGSYVTHEARHFVYFYLGQVAFLLFKSG